LSAPGTLGRHPRGGGRRSRRPARAHEQPDERAQALRRRALALSALATVAFAIGAVVGAGHGSSSAQALAARFVRAWTTGRLASMYADMDSASQQAVSAQEFDADYHQALRTATATGMRVAGRPRRGGDGLLAVPVRVRTRLFGTLALSFHVKVAQGPEGERIAWSRSLTFPGLRPGEHLSATTNLPRRATLLARDGSVLAETSSAGAGGGGEASARVSPLGDFATALLGSVGPVPAQRRAQLQAQGVPASATVGVSGLERALDDRLRGTPGGELRAVGSRRAAPTRLLASAAPRAARSVRTSVSPAVQRAAVLALGGQLGAIVVMTPSSGQILAVAGLGTDSLQPPGSTFKMVTVTGVLEAGVASARTVFPYATSATLDGVELSNANGESCGGTLALAFAVSCNSVFAPLGVKLGAPRLVATAERFGFNQAPAIAGAARSTLPQAGQIHGELDLGSTAIGQGRGLASALQMVIVAATIADDGRRPTATFLGSPGAAHRAYVTSSSVAHTVRRLMTDVVREGTGTSAAIPGVTVAGKTGTAELQTPSRACAGGGEEAGGGQPGEEARRGCRGAANEPSNTDAWFAAFAPALHPRVAVAVMLVKDGAGGDTAAPVARQVLEAGLAATR
jgi:Penicillin binding protein transpeptidase domain/Penicillin-binding Protein dimerisation domain/NTF2-like N-terminal transpeptidase domain